MPVRWACASIDEPREIEVIHSPSYRFAICSVPAQSPKTNLGRDGSPHLLITMWTHYNSCKTCTFAISALWTYARCSAAATLICSHFRLRWRMNGRPRGTITP